MALACEVRRVLSKNPNRIQPNDFKLKFSFKVNKPVKLTAEQRQAQIAATKARWFAAVGLKPQTK